MSAPVGPSDVNDQTFCPNGHMIGGGVITVGGREETQECTLNSTFPIDDASHVDTIPDDGWSVYTQYSDITETGSMLVDVICRGGAQPKYKFKSVDVAPGAAASIAARCAKGTRVIGGGAYIGRPTARWRAAPTPSVSERPNTRAGGGA
jgi:hypothetical protein